MKLLFCINNTSPKNLLATRNVFRNFKNTKCISAYKEYGYQERAHALLSVLSMEFELAKLINEFQPDVIHWNQLNDNYILSDDFLNYLSTLKKYNYYPRIGRCVSSMPESNC